MLIRRSWWLVVLWGCASSPGTALPVHGLRFGVDPHREATAVMQSFLKAGYQLHARLSGEAVEALGFVDRWGVSRGVRIVTMRGVALALDSVPKGALADRLEYYLYVPPMLHGLDVDGDGFEEVFVREVGREGGDCLVPYRVAELGHVQPVPLPLERFGSGACVRTVQDADHDQRVELLVEFRVGGLPLPRWPEVQVVLFPDGKHGFSVDGGERAAAVYRGEERARAQALAEALSQQNGPEVYRLAAEQALLGHLQGASTAQQLSQVKAAYAGLSERDQQVEAALVARIEEGW